MDYKDYTVEAFVLDEKFRKWVLEQDLEINDFWENWLLANPQKSETIQQARNLLLNIAEERYIYPQEREDLLWEKIIKEINSPTIKGKIISLHSREKQEENQTRRQYLKIHFKGRVAASLLILLSLGAAYFWGIKMDAESVAEVPQWIIKENPYGQKSTIYLSDGTEVILNAGSQIKYLEQFSADKREVSLKGEAFFKVARDTTRPFLVITKNIVTKALGTSFNVRAFSSESIQIALVTGKVLVNDTSFREEEGVILQPGESTTYSHDKPGEFLKQPFDSKMVLSWKDGILYFSDADEETVFSTLERWYGVEIEVPNPSPNVWEYTGEIANLSLNQLLQSLSHTMHFDYNIKNKKVTINYHE